MEHKFPNKEKLIELLMKEDNSITYEQAKKEVELEERNFKKYQAEDRIDRDFVRFASSLSKQVNNINELLQVLQRKHKAILSRIEKERNYTKNEGVECFNHKMTTCFSYNNKNYELNFIPYKWEEIKEY